jgi:hypothetical protein
MSNFIISLLILELKYAYRCTDIIHLYRQCNEGLVQLCRRKGDAMC